MTSAETPSASQTPQRVDAANSTAAAEKPSALRRWFIGAFLSLGNLHRRALVLVLAIVGPRVAYRVTERMAGWLYALLPALRARGEAQLRAALGATLAADEIPAVARRAFIHRMWCLTDIYLVPRWIQPGTIAARGGLIPEPHRSRLLDTARRGQPFILVSAYYGPYDLLPALLGYNGVRAGVVYRRHGHPGFDAFRTSVRSRTGCEMIPIEDAVDRLPKILEAGLGVALVADHHDERRGIDCTFLGLPTRVPRTIGVLAARHHADVVTAGIRRTRNPFEFEIDVTDVIDPSEWKSDADPVDSITRRYLRGLEKVILKDPSQYLWMQARWSDEALRAAKSE